MTVPEDRPTWQHGGLTVQRLGRALHLDDDGHGWLVGAPASLDRDASPDLIAQLGLWILPGDDVADLAGWLSVLDRRDAPLTIVHPLESDRIAALTDAWSRGWPDRAVLSSDAAAPGVWMEVDGGRIRFDGRGGVQIERHDLMVARSVDASAAGQRVLRGADLAVLVVSGQGPTDWTHTATLAPTLWVVDEHGAPWADARGPVEA